VRPAAHTHDRRAGGRAQLRQMLARATRALALAGDAGLAAAHATYNWERQLEVLDGVYARILARPA